MSNTCVNDLGDDIACPDAGGGDTGPSTTGGGDWPDDPGLTANLQIRTAPNGAKVVGGEGYSANGDRVHVDSADSVFAGGYVFNDVGLTDFTAADNKLTSATLTSNKDDNRIVIKNPLDQLGIEKFNIYLNNSQKLTYTYDGETVAITIPEKSRAVISKGSKNITVEPNGNSATIKIDNSKITGSKGTYDKPKYTISGANLTYQNNDIIERLVTTGESSVRIDTEKGFGYLLLTGKIGIDPGDSYEYHDLRKKEKSYSLYNPGTTQYEYGFLKSGFIFEMMPLIAINPNYGFEGSNELTLKGIVEYKRMQSYDQVKLIAVTYANYLAMHLPFLTNYKSEKTQNEYKIRYTEKNYTATHNYDTTENSISLQNSGHHRIAIEKHSPTSYYYLYNLQDCPNYLLKSSASPANSQISGELRIEKGTLTYRNWKVYTENTEDYMRINDKLKQMIITSNPEKYGSVDLG